MTQDEAVQISALVDRVSVGLTGGLVATSDMYTAMGFTGAELLDAHTMVYRISDEVISTAVRVWCFVNDYVRAHGATMPEEAKRNAYRGGHSVPHVDPVGLWFERQMGVA